MTRALIAWSAFAVCVVLALFCIVATVGPFASVTAPSGFALMSLAWVGYAVVGVAIVTRARQRSIGWICCAMGLTAEVQASTDVVLRLLATADPAPLAGLDSQLALWGIPLLRNLWVIAFALIAVLLLVFPTGHLPSPRWRWAMLLAGVFVPLGLITSSAPENSVSPLADFPLLEALLGDTTAREVREIGQGVVGFGMIALFLIAGGAIVVRFRRATGVQRQQLKWLAFSGIAFALVLVGTSIAFFSPLRVLDPGAPVPPAIFGGVPFVLALVGIPIAIAVAILRYRLYDIDVLINRTLVYGALTAILVATYASTVILLRQLSSWFTAGNDIAIAASTLLIAALFHPVRRRIQDVVDLRFYRRKYDAAKTVAAFSARLRQEVDLDALSGELLNVARGTMQPRQVSLWLRVARTGTS